MFNLVKGETYGEWEAPKSYPGFDEDQLRDKGVPEAAIDAVKSDAWKKLVNDECGRRILAVADREAQLNLTARVTVINGLTDADKSAEDNAVQAAGASFYEWVMAMVTAAREADPETGDAFLTDDFWPALDPATSAVVQLF